MMARTPRSPSRMNVTLHCSSVTSSLNSDRSTRHSLTRGSSRRRRYSRSSFDPGSCPLLTRGDSSTISAMSAAGRRITTCSGLVRCLQTPETERSVPPPFCCGDDSKRSTDTRTTAIRMSRSIGRGAGERLRVESSSVSPRHRWASEWSVEYYFSGFAYCLGCGRGLRPMGVLPLGLRPPWNATGLDRQSLTLRTRPDRSHGC